MDLVLTRKDRQAEGIFGELRDAEGTLIAETIEHAYDDGTGTYAPKIPNGDYVCVRGQHQLHSGPIETFEVMGVPGHTGVLLHPGNTESDSEGCILLGEARIGNMITNSRITFQKFMALEAGLSEFRLRVQG